MEITDSSLAVGYVECDFFLLQAFWDNFNEIQFAITSQGSISSNNTAFFVQSLNNIGFSVK